MSEIFDSEAASRLASARIDTVEVSITTDSNGAGSTTADFGEYANTSYTVGYAIEADQYCDKKWANESTYNVDIQIQNAPASTTVNITVTRFAAYSN